MGLIKEFKEFALKGNVMDMVVGVMIGGAFGGIVNSIINDMIMPVVGIAGKADFSNQYLPLTESARTAVTAAADPVKGLPSLDEARKLGPILAYGNFLTVTINFLILAFCVFVMVKAMNMARARFEKEKAAGPPPEPSADVKLLTEIRDILKTK